MLLFIYSYSLWYLPFCSWGFNGAKSLIFPTHAISLWNSILIRIMQLCTHVHTDKAAESFQINRKKKPSTFLWLMLCFQRHFLLSPLLPKFLSHWEEKKKENNKKIKSNLQFLACTLHAWSKNFPPSLQVIQVSHFNVVKYGTEFQPSPEGLQMYIAGTTADTETYWKMERNISLPQFLHLL